MKICSKCKAEKPSEEFNKQSKSRDGLQSRCKECSSACSAKYHAENRKDILLRMSKYHLENRDRLLARSRAYRSENHDYVLARDSAYRSSRPEKISEYKRTRRARKKNAEGRHTSSDVMNIFLRQRGQCANCHAKLFRSGRHKFHVDHIMPLALGGSNWSSNLQCLCPTCNKSKNAKDPIKWARQNGRLL